MVNALIKIMPVDIGVIHFVGIGGIGMSGLAEILHNLGYKVRGSDLSRSYVTDRLEQLGIEVHFQQEAANIPGAGIVVKSTAIPAGHPEIQAAVAAGIPVIARAEMLAELMRLKYSIAISGTHGKTTTTSMVAYMLEAAELHPTVINGGIINKMGTNAYLGQGDFLVAEADESDGTFIRIPLYAAVITNINPEHLSYYQTFAKAKEAYLQFIHNVPFYGFAVACFDCPSVREVAEQVRDRKVISYSLDYPQAQIRAINIRHTEEGMIFDVAIEEKFAALKKLSTSKLCDVMLGTHGRHNVSNALAAVAVALNIGIAPDTIIQALANFGGVKRRFTKVAEIDGISIIDDYAHHPVEIAAILSTAKSITERKGSKVIAIMQPHRHSRFKDLFTEFSTAFADADYVFIADIYAAGETPQNEVTTAQLVQKLIDRNIKAELLPDLNQAAHLIKGIAQRGDIVLFMGAGDITKYAYAMPQQWSAG